MTIKDIKPWEWAVASVLLLSGVGLSVLLLQTEDCYLTMLPLGCKVFYMAFCVLYAVVLLWALGGMYRMARWQERGAGLLEAFWIVTAADEVCHMVQTALILFTVRGVEGLDVFTVLFSVMEVLTMLLGVVVTVRLFHDAVKPLSTILVAFVVLPLLAGLLLPSVELMSLGGTLAMLLMTVLVALLFLFRNAPGEVDEEE